MPGILSVTGYLCNPVQIKLLKLNSLDIAGT